MFLRVEEAGGVFAVDGKRTKSESWFGKLVGLVAGVGSRGDWG